MNGDTEYNHGAVRPLVCYREGWQLIKGDYWVFFGITFVGLFLAYMLPLGILLGPMWCGFEIYLLRRMAGERGSFADLFDGFRYFLPSCVPAVLLITLASGAFVVIWLLYFGATMSVLFAEMGQGNPPGTVFAAAFGGLTILYALSVILVWVVLTAPFIFAFALIVERQMSGFAALWTSIKAIGANFWGILGLMVLEFLIESVGLSLGCIGWYFVVPMVLAADIVAYRQVFPHATDEEDWDEPELEPPAAPAGPASTGIRSATPRREEPPTGIAEGPPPGERN
jgi:hypothetical protein